MKNVLSRCHQLIESMTKSEKRFFVINTSKSSDHIQEDILFSVLSNMKTLDEKKLTTQLEKRGVKNYKILVHRLYKKILHALFENGQSHREELALIERIGHIYILKDRKLYDSAWELIQSMEKDVLESQSYWLQAQLMQLKHRIIVEQEQPLTEALGYLHQEKEILIHLEARCDFEMMRTEVNQLYRSMDASTLSQIDTQIVKMEQLLEKYPEDILMQDHLLEVKAIYYYSQEKNEDALVFFKKKKILYDKNPVFKDCNKQKYLIILTNLATALGYNKEYDYSLAILNEMVAYTQNDVFFATNKQKVAILIEINYLGNVLRAGVQDAFLERFIQENKVLDLNLVPHKRLYYLLRYRGIYYWCLGNLDEAITIFENIFSFKEMEMLPVEYVLIKLYLALIHIELGNYLLLTSFMRSIKYQLTFVEKHIMDEAELDNCIAFVGHIEKKAPIDKNEFKQLLKNYMLDKKITVDWKIGEEFNFGVWVQSVLQEKKMVTLLKQYLG